MILSSMVQACNDYSDDREDFYLDQVKKTYLHLLVLQFELIFVSALFIV